MEDRKLFNEIKKADYYLLQFEKKVVQAKGAPFSIPYEGKEALKRIKQLKQNYPEHDKIETLFQRARICLKSSKGETTKITPDVLAYRDQEKKLRSFIKDKTNTEWENYIEQIKSKPSFITKTYPIPNPDEVSITQLKGSYVILNDFEYPACQFYSSNKSYLYSGSSSKGYYFSDLSDKSFLTAYNAVKRYRHKVSSDIPIPWTVVGRVKNFNMLIPDASEKPITSIQEGWEIDIEAIYIKDQVFALCAQGDAVEGTYIGESDLEKLKKDLYTIKSIPEKVNPIELVTIFATAIKEKNLELYFECLHSSFKATPTAESRAMYYWENNQERYRNMYVLVEPDEETLKIKTLKGEKIDSTEDFFLTEDDQESILKTADDLVEEALVYVNRYNEKGKQLTPNPIYLRREREEEWKIYNGFPL